MGGTAADVSVVAIRMKTSSRSAEASSAANCWRISSTVPWATFVPPLRIRIRGHNSYTRCSRWELSITAAPSAATRRIMSFI